MQEGELLEIPGTAIGEAIKKIWQTGLVNNISADYKIINHKSIALLFKIEETPILSNVIVYGVSDVEAKDLLNLSKPFSLKKFSIAEKHDLYDRMHNYMLSRGYYFIKVDTSVILDSLSNTLQYVVAYQNKEVVRISKSFIHTEVDTIDLKKNNSQLLNEVSRPNSIFTPNLLLEDEKIIASHYLNLGYRDFAIETIIIPDTNDHKVELIFKVNKGVQYRFGDLVLTGNTSYADSLILNIIGIKPGQIYNEDRLVDILNLSPDGNDVSALYMNNGHLLFKIEYELIALRNDSIDVLIRINEGPKVRIGDISIHGNKKTEEKVIRRHITDKPGDLFNRSNLFISRNKLSYLPYIDPESVNVIPILQADSTVKIEYHINETTINDRVFAAGGWGGSIGLVGTIGLNLNNFSAKNIFRPSRWKPLPVGDGQLLSLKAQTNATNFTSFAINFSEPWIGGKKPNKLNFTGYYSRYSPEAFDGGFYKTSLITLNYVHPFNKIYAWNIFGNFTRYNIYKSDSVLCKTCVSNKFMFGFGLTRNSSRNTYSGNYPSSGSRLNLSLALTLPHSHIKPSIEQQNVPEKYRWVEYHKWSMDYEKYFTLITNQKDKTKKLVLACGIYAGLIGSYNKNLGVGPFDRYILGGDGLSGFYSVLGSDFIRLRGYENQSIKPSSNGGVLFHKISTELRYPLLQNKKWAIYGIGFAEVGNSFNNLDAYTLYSSAGAGFRFELNRSQVFGIDLGKGFNEVTNCADCNKWQPHFTFGFTLK